jgi:hypothetical protein
MSRSCRRLRVALGLLLTLASVASACGGPTLPALSDPIEIVTAGLNSTETARTVHLDITLDGKIDVDISGGAGTSTTFSLAGTSASADIDMAGGRAHATFAAPGLLILSGELIQIGPTSYLKTSLTGPLFETREAVDSLPVDPTDTSAIFDDLKALLLVDDVDPLKGDDVECGGKQCYTVMIELTADELAALGVAGLAPADLPIELPFDPGDVSAAVTVRVEKETHRLAGVTSVVSLGEAGSLTLDVTATNWDQPMNISPPPADQVKPTS